MNRIKELREEKNLSQEELASELGLSKGIISLYEQEKRKPSLDVLIQLSDFFNVTLDYLLCRTNDRNNVLESLEIAASTKDHIDLSEVSDRDKEIIMNIISTSKKDID